VKSGTRQFIAVAILAVMAVSFCGCRDAKREQGDVVFVIESNPANLDPRYATDGQSQRIDRLIFNGLVIRDSEMNLHGDLAESWETPDPLTYIFHLKPSVKFHDGRPLTSTDVKATFEYMMNAENRSPKRGSFRLLASIETPDAQTVIFRLKEPYASFLWNLERSASGIVPAGSGKDFATHLIGSGPFRFVSQRQDDEVVLERTAQTGARGQDENVHVASVDAKVDSKPASLETRGAAPKEESPNVERVTFRIVPDAIVRALELRKGSADVEVSSLSPDMIPVLTKQEDLKQTDRPGTNFAYLGVNFADRVLAKKEVRQALAYATDRESLVKYLLHGQARLASGILPPNHWAYDQNVKTYGYEPAQAERLLDAAGLRRGPDGTRVHLTLKVTTQEAARLLGAALQEEWKKVGIALEVRPLETATFFSDLTKGNFQLSYAIWVGANTDPDVFGYVFSTRRFPPEGANRGHYRNARVDELTLGIQTESDQAKRKELCAEVQRIVAEELPYVPLWYVDVVSVHRKEFNVQLTPTGDYDFLIGETSISH
jgi:peptide/nickel transport system substrate-binding protein